MHDTAMEIGSLVMDRYSDLPRATILELGSYDVNGSLRSHALATTQYVGLDLEAGPGVDFVVEVGKPWPVEDDAFDLVIASSVFEHDPFFWMTFLQMVRKARPGGYIYISAPSNGSIHRYPEDHWRFYPDSGRALERWAAEQGQPVRLVESFTAPRKGDEWNDFVAVFRKGESTAEMLTSFVHQQVGGMNVMTWESHELLNPSSSTEDMDLLAQLRSELGGLQQRFDSKMYENQIHYDAWQAAEREKTSIEGRLHQLQVDQDAAMQRLVELGSSLGHRTAELDRLKKELAEQRVLSAKLDESEEDRQLLRDLLASSQSNLRQRQEEIAQTQAELTSLRVDHERIVAELQTMSLKVDEANAWVFKISGERREAEIALERLSSENRKQKIRIQEAASRIRHLEEDAAMAAARFAETQRVNAEQIRHLEEINELSAKKITELEFAACKDDSEKYLALQEELSEKLRIIDQLSLDLDKSSTDKIELSNDRERLLHEAVNVTRDAEERLREIVTLSRLLGSRESAIAGQAETISWFKSLHFEIARQPWWWALLPAKQRRQRELDRLARLGVFNGEEYLMRYPDVREHGMDPLEHYVRHGIDELRHR